MNPADLHDTFERLAGHTADPSEEDTSQLLKGVHHRERRRRTTARLVASGVVVAVLVVIAGTVAIALHDDPKPHVVTVATYGTALPRAAGPSAQAWAKGTWADLPKPPIDCGADSRAFWVNGRLVVVQPEHGEGNSAPGPWIGATFDPESASWTRLPVTPSALGAGANAAVAGDRLLLWGGSTAHTKSGHVVGGPVGMAFALDTSSSTWHRVANPPSAATSAAVTAWTGRRLVMVNLASANQLVSYDPASDTWSVTAGAPDLRALGRQAVASSILWTGKDVLVWFDTYDGTGEGGHQYLERYDPIDDRWSRVAGIDGRPAVTDVAMVDGKVIAREFTTRCGGGLGCPMETRGRIVTIDPTTGEWSAGSDAPTAYLPVEGRPGETQNDPVDPGSQQLAIGGIPIRLAIVGEPKLVERQAQEPEPGQWPVAVEAYDGSHHRWVAAGLPPQQLHPIMRKDLRPFPTTPDLLWTGQSLVVWGQFNCVEPAKCAQPKVTQGLLYTPQR